MQILLVAGVIVVVASLIALGFCILAALRLRRGGLPASETRAGLQRLAAVNLAALGAAGLGLGLVVLGLLL